MVSLTPSRFIPGERTPNINWIGGREGPRASVDAMAKRHPIIALVRN